MLDGRFDPEFYRTLAVGQVSGSERPHDNDDMAFDQVTPRIWLSVAGLVAIICLVPLA